MSAYATFTGPAGEPAGVAIRREIHALTTPTVGDHLFVGQVFRSRIRQRTAEGIDANGNPFAAYSTNGPYYFYPNRDSAGGNLAARSTAAAGRFAKTKKGGGKRTSLGIRYHGGYAEAKAAHGRATVDLYGMEQHTHMLDTMLVQAGGSEIGTGIDLDFGSEFAASENIAPCSELTLGFYGPEAERARGNNEGTEHTPARFFFGLNEQDLQLGAQAIGERMEARARAKA